MLTEPLILYEVGGFLYGKMRLVGRDMEGILTPMYRD